MSEYVRLSQTRIEFSILRLTIATNNFKIKLNIIQMVQQFIQLDGFQDGDPNSHITNFLKVCDAFKINAAIDDAIKLRLFSLLLRNQAKQWLISLPRGFITTQNQMTKKTLSKCFPLAKTTKIRNDIFSYVEMEPNTLYDMWERFKDLIKRCPHHNLPTQLQVQTFYIG